MLLKEAEEAKDLWEKEVVSRSKLGIRVRMTLFISTSFLLYFLVESIVNEMCVFFWSNFSVFNLEYSKYSKQYNYCQFVSVTIWKSLLIHDLASL